MKKIFFNIIFLSFFYSYSQTELKKEKNDYTLKNERETQLSKLETNQTNVNEKISDENNLIINKQSARILSNTSENISKNEVQNSEEKDKKLPACRTAQNRILKDPEED
jgi:hypothetical protein